jgi:hypothetical protein
MNRTITLVIAKAVLGAGLVLGFAAAPQGTAHAAPAGTDVYAYEVGDDNENGVIEEEESGFDCRVMGNRICGPGAVLPDGTSAIPGDYTTVWADGSPAWPSGEYAYDAGAYVGGYN